MPLYFLLGTLSQDGQKLLCNNADLAVEAVRSVDVEDADILGQYAVLGRYDFILLAEAEDNEAAAKLSLDIGVRMGMHIETLPAIAIGVLLEGGQAAEEEEAGVPENPSTEWRIPPNDPC